MYIAVLRTLLVGPYWLRSVNGRVLFKDAYGGAQCCVRCLVGSYVLVSVRVVFFPKEAYGGARGL